MTGKKRVQRTVNECLPSYHTEVQSVDNTAVRKKQKIGSDSSRGFFFM